MTDRKGLGDAGQDTVGHVYWPVRRTSIRRVLHASWVPYVSQGRLLLTQDLIKVLCSEDQVNSNIVDELHHT